ncbi:MAG: hypothetical protein Kow00117_11200 [Phototrophicales bacterium]
MMTDNYDFMQVILGVITCVGMCLVGGLVLALIVEHPTIGILVGGILLGGISYFIKG